MPDVWIVVLHVLLALLSLVWLRSRKLEQGAQAIWVLMVLIIPVLGSVALAIVQPGTVPPPVEEPRFELEEFRRQ